MDEQIKLGDDVRDTVTGLVGRVVGYISNLYGPDAVIVASYKPMSDGRPMSDQMFFVNRVVEIKKKTATKAKPKAEGGAR